MRHTLRIERVAPWPQFNEYEGEVEGQLDGHPVIAHVYLTGETWDSLRPGEEREVWAKLDRSGDVAIVDPSTQAELTRLNGVHTAIVGTVRARDGEALKVESIMTMDVDLELAPFLERAIPDVQVGDRIRLEGTIEIDFDPDDYDED